MLRVPRPRPTAVPMRLATLHAARGTTVAGVILEDGGEKYVDLNAVDGEVPRSMRELLTRGDGLDRAAAALEKGKAAGRFVTGDLLPPVPDPGKVICVGLNYRDHAAETGAAIPDRPVIFGKFSSAITGPGAAVSLPKASRKVDFEAELVAVIGRAGKHVAEGDALAHVAGYTNGHDVSARDWQKGDPGGQWLLGKTPDAFAPIGPHLVTADEAGDPHAMRVTLTLNGETMQDGTTADFIFPLGRIIAHVSQLVTLTPGDVIFTGTPAGVGAARTPPVFLKDGDEVTVTCGNLGSLTNTFVDES